MNKIFWIIAMMVIVATGEPEKNKDLEVISIKLIRFDRASGKYEISIKNTSERAVFVNITQLEICGFSSVDSQGSAGEDVTDTPEHQALYFRLNSSKTLPDFKSEKIVSGIVVNSDVKNFNPLEHGNITLKFMVKGYAGDSKFSYSKEIDVAALETK